MKLFIIKWNFKYKAILSYSLRYAKNREKINPKVLETNHGKTMLLSKCTLCDIVKNQDLLKNKKQVKY